MTIRYLGHFKILLFLTFGIIAFCSCANNSSAEQLADEKITNVTSKTKKKYSYYDFLKDNKRLTPKEIKDIRIIYRKYAKIKKSRKKQKKWSAVKYKSFRKKHASNQTKEVKTLLGPRYKILQQERKRWKSRNKKK